MKHPIFSIALTTIFGIGLAAAAPLPQDQAPQDQAAPQGQARHMATPAEQAQRMAKRLNLSTDQVSQITPILSDMQSKMQDLRGDSSLSRDDRMAKMKSIREDNDTKIKAVLNDDQKAKYEKMMEAQREHMQERRQNGGAAPSNQ